MTRLCDRAPGTLVVPDGCPLSPRQLWALDLAGRGLTLDQVAREMNVASVTSLLWEARKKLGVRTSIEAVLYCDRRGWLTASPTESSDLPLLFEYRRLTRLLIEAVRFRHTSKLSDCQRDYLSAFERMLKTPNGTTRRETAQALDAMLAEIGLSRSERKQGDRALLAAVIGGEVGVIDPG